MCITHVYLYESSTPFMTKVFSHQLGKPRAFALPWTAALTASAKVSSAEACSTQLPLRKFHLCMLTKLAVTQRRRGSQADPISEDDLLRAIGKLKILGGGWSLTKVSFSPPLAASLQ